MHTKCCARPENETWSDTNAPFATIDHTILLGKVGKSGICCNLETETLPTIKHNQVKNRKVIKLYQNLYLYFLLK